MQESGHVYNDLKWAGWSLGEYGTTPAACSSFVTIFDSLLRQLIELGPQAAEEPKIACFEQAVTALNALNKEDDSLIETGEREQLCELCNRIAVAVGIEPGDYGDGEGPASEWRDW